MKDIHFQQKAKAGVRLYYHAVVFKTKVLHLKVENTPTKDKNGKGKFKRILSFAFVDKRKLSVAKFFL